jgi:hypothetical protein
MMTKFLYTLGMVGVVMAIAIIAWAVIAAYWFCKIEGWF